VARENSGVAVFNEAFTTESSDYVTHSEGCELCASDHPYPNGSASTQSNEGTSTLSPTSVEATRLLMKKFTGENGEQISINPDMLILGLDDEEVGYEIINSKGKVNMDSNNVNFHYGKYTSVTWNALSSGMWFMVDSSLMKEYLKWYDRIPLETMQDKDSDTLVAKYIGYCRFYRWWINWRFIYGHKYA
jgi:hypothetical protein